MVLHFLIGHLTHFPKAPPCSRCLPTADRLAPQFLRPHPALPAPRSVCGAVCHLHSISSFEISLLMRLFFNLKVAQVALFLP